MSNIEELFLNASQLSPCEREKFLIENCPDKSDFDRLSSLLAAHDQADDFMESPPVDIPLTGDWPFAEETRKQFVEDTFSPLLEKLFPCSTHNSQSEIGNRKGMLGHYEIESILGQGGMGMVLKGFDTKLKRMVAIKILPRSFHSQDRQRKRFVREAQSAARLSHPNIVAVHAVEDTEFPHIVMEFVPGQTLGELIRNSGKLPVQKILDIGKQMADGLAAAHNGKLIHRDIKPSNILVNEDGKVKIVDFGLAKELYDAERHDEEKSESPLSCAGELYGTPQFMSPEQANGEELDFRSDLFSMGSVLYMLCTGESPFHDESFVRSLKQVSEQEPAPISEFRDDIPLELQELIQSLMCKLPADRIESAEAAADCLDRIRLEIEKEPPQPTPRRDFNVRPGRQRNRVSYVVMTMVIVISVMFISEGMGFTNFSNRFLDVIRVKTAHGTIVVAVDDPDISVAIDGNRIRIGEEGRTIIQYEIGEHQIRATKNGKVVLDKVVTLTRDGKQVVSITNESSGAGHSPSNGTAKKPATSNSLANVSPILDDPITINGHTNSIHSLCFSPDGKNLATGQLGFKVRVWSIVEASRSAEPSVLFEVRSERQMPHRVLFSPDGKRLHCGTFQWNAKTGKKLPNLSAPIVAWNASGKHYATQPQAGVIQIHLADSNEVVKSIDTNQGKINACEFSPDGSLLATAGSQSTRIWDVATGSKKLMLQAGNRRNFFVSFSRDGKKLVSGGEDQVAWIWNVAQMEIIRPKPVATLVGHQDNVYGARFIDDGKRVITVSRESARTFPMPGKKNGQTLKFWDAETGEEVWDQTGHWNNVTDIDLRHDSIQFATCGLDKKVKLWNLKPVRKLKKTAATNR